MVENPTHGGHGGNGGHGKDQVVKSLTPMIFTHPIPVPSDPSVSSVRRVCGRLAAAALLIFPSALHAADASIAFGTKHAIALRANGDVLTWGDNGACQLGRPARSNNLGTPDLVMRNAKEIAAASQHNLVLTNDGKVYGWGTNPEGALGVGDSYDKCEGPVLVKSLADKVITHISTGHGFSVAVTSTGDLYCAGDNSMGQCPAAKSGRLETFALVPLPEIAGKVVAVQSGSFHTLVLTKDGRLYAFGRGRDGQLGNGKTANGAGYVQDLADVVSFGAGTWHSVALTKDGTVWVWGNNSKSQLCDGATTNRAVPAKVESLPGAVTRVVAGAHGTALVTRDGGLFVCGDNQSGSLGIGAEMVIGRLTKVAVAPIKGALVTLGGNDAEFSPDGCSIRMAGYNDNAMITPTGAVDSRVFVARALLTLCAAASATPLPDVVHIAPSGGASGCWTPRVEENQSTNPKWALLRQALVTA